MICMYTWFTIWFCLSRKTILFLLPTARFTISAFNNYGFVKSFLSRVEALHPDITCLIWVVADNRQVWGAQADKSLPSKILDDLPKRWHSVMVEELQPHMNFSFLELAFRYDLQCFNTAIKPAAFKFIFDRYKPSKILYFDNDASLLSHNLLMILYE